MMHYLRQFLHYRAREKGSQYNFNIAEESYKQHTLIRKTQKKIKK